MTTAQLIALILQAVAATTPQLVKDVVDLIHGNPQQQGETDDAYIARINGQIDGNAAKIAQEDAEIQQDS